MDASNFEVRFYLNNNLLETKTVAGPWVQERLDSIPFIVDMSQTGTYLFRAEVSYTPDTTFGNNSFTLNYNHRPPIDLNTNAFVEKFTGTEWLKHWNIEDADGNGFTWGRSTVYFKNTCSYPGQNASPTNTQIGNDWVMNGCFVLEKDSVYTMSNVYQWFNPFNNSYKLFLGTKPTRDSMLTQLDYVTMGNPTPPIPLLRKKNFTVAKTGIYFIGFNTTEIPWEKTLDIDDVSVSQIKDLNLGITRLIAPSDSGWYCSAAPSPIKLRLENQGRKTFSAPTFRILVDGPIGSQDVSTFLPISLNPGQVKEVELISSVDMSQTGTYSITIINTSAQDQMRYNDTLLATYKVYPDYVWPTVADFNNNDNGVNFYAPPFNWFGASENFQRFNETIYTKNNFGGGNKFKNSLISRPFSRILAASPHFSIDIKLQNVGSTNYVIQPTDTIDLYASINCQPFVQLQRLWPGTILGPELKTILADISPLGPIDTADRVCFKVVVSHTNVAWGDGHEIWFDNFKIVSAALIDAALLKPVRYPYSAVPQAHAPDFAPAVSVRNSGYSNLLPVSVSASILPDGYLQTISTSGSFLLQQSSQSIAFPSFSPGFSGIQNLVFKAQTSSSQVDGLPLNNVDTSSFTIGDTSFSRHYGPKQKRLGFTGTSSRGMMEQVFELKQSDTLTSMSFWIDSLSANT